MDKKKLAEICGENKIRIDEKALDLLLLYAENLAIWNGKINLVSRKDDGNLIERHILHSLLILKHINLKKGARCLDIGTGGGMPGIPLKIARPGLYMLMVDSIQKKIVATEDMANATGLTDLEARCIRAEQLIRERSSRHSFDYVTARAVARINKLIDWSKPLLKRNGKFIFLKGGDLKDEITEAKQRQKGLRITEHRLTVKGAEWFIENEKKLLICEFEQTGK